MTRQIKLPPADADGLSKRRFGKNVYREYRVLRSSGSLDSFIRRTYAKQDAKCFYCMKTLKGKRLNVEHVQSISSGGTNSSKNLVLSCAGCNRKKAGASFSRDFVKKRRKVLAKSARKSAHEYNNKINSESELALWIRSWA